MINILTRGVIMHLIYCNVDFTSKTQLDKIQLDTINVFIFNLLMLYSESAEVCKDTWSYSLYKDVFIRCVRKVGERRKNL